MEAIDSTKLSLEEVSGKANWSMEVASGWPQQDNGSDCGLFAIVGCECAAFELPMRMSSERALFFRRKVGADIMNQKLV
jgi:Ulp1 family protease